MMPSYAFSSGQILVWSEMKVTRPCEAELEDEDEARAPQGRGFAAPRGFYLRKRVLKLVFLSQFPYKFVNLFFSLRIS